MTLKKLPYWLKGGIIPIIFISIIRILLVFFPTNSILAFFWAFFWMMPGMLLLIPFYSLWFHGIYVLKITSILFWITMFILIGYLYERMKKS